MMIVTSAKYVRCPVCDYEGKAKVRALRGFPLGVTTLVLVAFALGAGAAPVGDASAFLLAALVTGLAWILQPSVHACPNCGNPHPVPIKMVPAHLQPPPPQ